MQNLDRDRATEHEIVGLPNFSHSADRKLMTQLVSLREQTTGEGAARVVRRWRSEIVRVHAVS
jgi:hypothetical protein